MARLQQQGLQLGYIALSLLQARLQVHRLDPILVELREHLGRSGRGLAQLVQEIGRLGLGLVQLRLKVRQLNLRPVHTTCSRAEASLARSSWDLASVTVRWPCRAGLERPMAALAWSSWVCACVAAAWHQASCFWSRRPDCQAADLDPQDDDDDRKDRAGREDPNERSRAPCVFFGRDCGITHGWCRPFGLGFVGDATANDGRDRRRLRGRRRR
jgi:hypothetical protein